MEEIEERMKQRKLEKFEEHKGTMQQQIAINIIARLQRLNPDLQLNPDLLAFCARSCSSEQTEGPLSDVDLHSSSTFVLLSSSSTTLLSSKNCSAYTTACGENEAANEENIEER
ncbi:hypothetical protein FXO37_19228 [Capsicum annuum]|nr:hypothetical protein FXO37_19228 [Capsicum annuum]